MLNLTRTLSAECQLPNQEELRSLCWNVQMGRGVTLCIKRCGLPGNAHAATAQGRYGHVSPTSTRSLSAESCALRNCTSPSVRRERISSAKALISATSTSVALSLPASARSSAARQDAAQPSAVRRDFPLCCVNRLWPRLRKIDRAHPRRSQID